MKNSLLTVVCVVVALIVGWFVIDAVFSIAWFIAKAIGALIVAAIVFAVLRFAFSRTAD